MDATLCKEVAKGLNNTGGPRYPGAGTCVLGLTPPCGMQMNGRAEYEASLACPGFATCPALR